MPRCPRCRQVVSKCECERWDRIFKEKFEDPTYYQPRELSLQSSLAGLEALDLRSLEIPSEVDPRRWHKEMNSSAKAALDLRDLKSEAA